MSETGTNVKSNEDGGMFSSLYSGSADLGVFMADLGMIVGLILGVILLLMGSNRIMFEDNLHLEVVGKVVKSSCQASNINLGRNSATTYKCNVIVTYKVGETVYNRPLFVNSAEQYVDNEPITLWVDKSDFTNVSVSGYNGPTLMSLALLIVGVAYFNYYLTHRFKFYAAGRGTSAVFNMFN